eukprot:gene9027-1125_t
MSLVEVQLDELLVSIFEYLPSKDIRSVREVSKKFNILANHYTIYQSLCKEVGYPVDTDNYKPDLTTSWKEFYELLLSRCNLVIYKNSLTPLLTLYEELKELLEKHNFELEIDLETFEDEYENNAIVKLLNNERLCRVLKLNNELKQLGLFSDIFSFDLDELKVETKEKEKFILQLLNDDDHSFNQVIKQLRLCGFSYQDADKIAWKTHANGMSDIMIESKEQCEKNQKILQKIRLASKIIPFEFSPKMLLKQKIEQVPVEFQLKKDDKLYQLFLIYIDDIDISELFCDLQNTIQDFEESDFHLILLGISIRGTAKIYEGSKEECQKIASLLGEKDYEIAIVLSK